MLKFSLTAFIFFYLTCLPTFAQALDVAHQNKTAVKNSNPVTKELACTTLLSLPKKTLDSSFIYPNLVEEFYRSFCTLNQPYAWFDENGDLSVNGKNLLLKIQESKLHGLDPLRYHFDLINTMLAQLDHRSFFVSKDLSQIAQLDTILTDAYFTLSHDHYVGITNWQKYSTQKIGSRSIEWDRPLKKEINWPNYLLKNLANQNIPTSIDILIPALDQYQQLLKAYAFYITLSETKEWQPISLGLSICYKSDDVRLPQIKQRLYDLGILKTIDAIEYTIYDEESVIKAIKSFQLSHQLTPDGIIGDKTIIEMNILPKVRAQTIAMNLERLRWEKTNYETLPLYFFVNIPSYLLAIYDHNHTRSTVKVIVGKKERPSPILTSRISHAIIHPSWRVPDTIVKEDILTRTNPAHYLTHYNIQPYEKIDGELVPVDPTEIDWFSPDKTYLKTLIFKADPGKKNPLGNIKFMFPNKYAVYLHDTNQRSLFNLEKRALSSGCIRVNLPFALLEYLHPKQPISFIQKTESKSIVFQQKLPIFIRYMTAYVDENQQLYFYKDIYGYDSLLENTTISNKLVSQ